MSIRPQKYFEGLLYSVMGIIYKYDINHVGIIKVFEYFYSLFHQKIDING
jgi:hypothetical protein